MIFFWILLVLSVLWFLIFLMFNDFFVVNKKKFEFENVLIVYPHPDDEVLSCSGLISKYSKKSNFYMMILSKGEKGNKNSKRDTKLKEIRHIEAKKVSKNLGVKKLIHKDLGDGKLSKNSIEVEVEIKKQIKNIKPDLILTYDGSGLYGHPDHIVVSDIVTKIAKKKGIKLWYSSIPKKLYNLANLPEHMAIYESFKDKRKEPTFKFFVGKTILKKIKSIYLYKSQRFAFRRAFVIPLPFWFYVSAMIFEYFQ